MTFAHLIQQALGAAPEITPVLEAAERCGAEFLAEKFSESTIILGLMPDGSLFLASIMDDPADETKDSWHTAAFPSLSLFGKYLNSAIQSTDAPTLPPELHQYLQSTVNKYILARYAEVGHA